MSDFRLLQLGKDHRGEVLPKGVPTLLSKGVMVTLADNDGNVMIEHSNGRVGNVTADVKVDGKAIYEIAHVRPLQVIEIDGAQFVLMSPYGAFVQEFQSRVPMPVVKPAKQPAKKSKPKTKAAATEKPRLRLVYVAAPAVLALLGLGVSLIPEKDADSKPVVQAEEEAEEEIAEVSEETEAAPEAAAVAAAPAPAPAPVAAPEAAAPAAALPAPAAPAEPVEAAAAAVAAAPAPAVVPPPPPAPPKSPAPKATTVKPAKPAKESGGKALPAAKEAQLRSLIESYQLEAGFDPEGAARKLKALKKQVPANARVQKDIDRALQGLRS